MQMLVYALAAETILKSPPAELTLCFLRPGLEYHFDWDPAPGSAWWNWLNRQCITTHNSYCQAENRAI